MHLDNGGHEPSHADAIGAHHDRVFLALRIEIGGADRFRVVGPELEAVPQLDGRFGHQCTSAGKAELSRFRLSDVCQDRHREVAGVVDAHQVVAVSVRASDEVASYLNGRIGHDQHAGIVE
jgi:hypothetical protein